jgi:amino-acid N-acetyltransferase
MSTNGPGKAIIRAATLADVDQVKALIDQNADQGLMLPRTLSELSSCIRDFIVCERNNRVIGCVALHVFTRDLAEIRSLAVESEAKGSGLGRDLVARVLEDARSLGVKQVFGLTFVPVFFEKCGFRRLENKSDLPHKVWTECIRCPHFPECKEEAVIMDL